MRVGWGWRKAGQGGSKKSKLILTPFHGAGLKSCPITAPPTLRGGENSHRTKQRGTS